MVVATMPGCNTNSSSTAARVELKKNEAGYHRLFVNDQEFYVEGAGLEFGNIEALAEYGGNSFRTWRTTNENEDALNLENGFKLPFVVAMNCLNGLFQDVYQDSLAEALLMNPDGGAVMVWASSALTDPTGQDLMNRDLYSSLFDGSNPSVGDAVLEAKTNGTDQDTRNTWILFGDPSMRLKR